MLWMAYWMGRPKLQGACAIYCWLGSLVRILRLLEEPARDIRISSKNTDKKEGKHALLGVGIGWIYDSVSNGL